MRQDSFLGPLLLSEKKKQNKAKKTEPGNEVGLNLKRCFLFLSRISEKKFKILELLRKGDMLLVSVDSITPLEK